MRLDSREMHVNESTYVKLYLKPLPPTTICDPLNVYKLTFWLALHKPNQQAKCDEMVCCESICIEFCNQLPSPMMMIINIKTCSFDRGLSI